MFPVKSVYLRKYSENVNLSLGMHGFSVVATPLSARSMLNLICSNFSSNAVQKDRTWKSVMLQFPSHVNFKLTTGLLVAVICLKKKSDPWCSCMALINTPCILLFLLYSERKLLKFFYLFGKWHVRCIQRACNRRYGGTLWVVERPHSQPPPRGRPVGHALRKKFVL
jgi:hypothetical protein